MTEGHRRWQLSPALCHCDSPRCTSLNRACDMHKADCLASMMHAQPPVLLTWSTRSAEAAAPCLAPLQPHNLCHYKLDLLDV